jgi:D-alanine-D-alanine ligase
MYLKYMPNHDIEAEVVKPDQFPKQINLTTDKEALKKLRLVIVAFSKVEREFFKTNDAYIAEAEVIERAEDVVKTIKDLGVEAKGLPGDQYFLTNLLVDHPDLVVNLVDTLKGQDRLQTSVPAALELANVLYTGAGMEGMVIGNNRNLTKRLLLGYDIPTPDFQFIRRAGTKVDETMPVPLIVKLNESGGSVGINNNAVKESIGNAQKQVDKMLTTYKIPVVIERFVDGAEITVCVFDDGNKKHVFMGQKVFKYKPDGKHFFTSIESYEDLHAYKYKHVEEPLRTKIGRMAIKAFNALYHRDYAKFDVRVDDQTGVPYFTDSNPNTAFGPDMGLPFTEVAALHGITFVDLIGSLLSKYAKRLT